MEPAEELRIPVEPQIIVDLERRPRCKSDSVHFNRTGYARLAEAVLFRDGPNPPAGYTRKRLGQDTTGQWGCQLPAAAIKECLGWAVGRPATTAILPRLRLSGTETRARLPQP